MHATTDRSFRRKSDKILSTARELRGVRDVRIVHPPAEIPYQLGTTRRQGAISSGTDRPATVGAHNHPRQRDPVKPREGSYSASSSSYFPRINESSITREFREHKAKHSSALALSLPLSARRPLCDDARATSASHGRRATARGRLESETVDETRRDYGSMRGHRKSKATTSVAMSLDKQGMETLYNAFDELETLDQEEFVTEMLQALNAHTVSEDQRVEMTSQVSDLFRQADLSSRGYLTWGDFSSFFSQTSDVESALEDTGINKYQGDDTPSSINFVSEIQGLIYLPEIDQVMIHDSKHTGFQVYDVPSNRIRTTLSGSNNVGSKTSRGHIVDAVYTRHGRYIITASTSPVISFYDADQLHIRQQIPTDSFQTALALDASSQSTGVLYSASADGKVHAWDLESLTRRHTFMDTTALSANSPKMQMITDLEVLPATSLLACGSMDGKIYMLDVAVGKVAKTLSGHTKGVAMLRYCAENKYLVSGGIDHKLQVWNPHLEQKVGSLPGHRSQLIGLHVRPNSPEIITADESGVMKIWDLRKFAAVQTIVKELYVKTTPHSAFSTTRAMTAMCYIESQQRIAIAHSTLFFLDPVRVSDGQQRTAKTNDASRTHKKKMTPVSPHGDYRVEEENGAVYDDGEDEDGAEEEEENKPLEVLFHPPTQCFVAITPWQIVCWEAATGARVRVTPLALGPEATCVAVMDDYYSCFVGCEDGSVARLVLPNAAIVVHKPVHTYGEVTALRLSMAQRTILTSGSDGNVIVSHWETLEPLHVLNHWRGVRSVRSIPRGRVDVSTLTESYSVPLHLRPYFVGNEIERLTIAFAEEDPLGRGTISLSALPRVLERVFPTSNPAPASVAAEPSNDPKTLTFAMFVDVVKDALTGGNVANKKGPALASVSSFAVDSAQETLVTASSSENCFCLWNLKNAAVIGEGYTTKPNGSAAQQDPRDARDANSSTSPASSPSRNASTRQPIATVIFLSPMPYFVCVDADALRLTIWSSVAMPPFTRRAYQCVLAYTLTNAIDLRTRASTMDLRIRTSVTFLTEPTIAASATTDKLVIRAIHWFLSERDDKKLLCIGDDRGQIHILDCKGLFRRVDDLRRQSKKPAIEHSRIANSSSSNSNTNHHELLPPTLLQKLNRWSAHPYHDRVGLQSVRVVDIENVIQPNANKRAIVISISDHGAVQLWSLDGQRLGRLKISGAADSYQLRRQWKLQVDEDELHHKNHESALTILKQVEQRLSVSLNHQQHQQPHVNATGASGLLFRRPTSDGTAGATATATARQRPSPRVSARQLTTTALPLAPTARSSGMSLEDALVAWRRRSKVDQQS